MTRRAWRARGAAAPRLRPLHRRSSALAPALALTVLCACESSSQPAPSGEELYADNCVSCHGPLGEGDGPVAAVLRVSMPNLRSLAIRNNGEFPADSVRAYIDGREVPASHGDRYMPVWGNEFGWAADPAATGGDAQTAHRIDAIVEYLRELQYR